MPYLRLHRKNARANMPGSRKPVTIDRGQNRIGVVGLIEKLKRVQLSRERISRAPMSKRGTDRHNHLRSACAAALFTALLSQAVPAPALPGDRDQPIHITADQALRDEKQGVTVYSGNVHLVQGTMKIDADRLTIHHVSEELDRVIAEGRPAKLQQQPEVEKGPLHARARVITYYRVTQRVHLEHEAQIEREGATVTGDSIDYFIEQQLVRADAAKERQGSRVQVVIPPTTVEEFDGGATDGE